MSAREPSKKRKREGGKEKPTVGQLTSHIKNKQVRADQYGKLRHKAKVHHLHLSLFTSQPTLLHTTHLSLTKDIYGTTLFC